MAVELKQNGNHMVIELWHSGPQNPALLDVVAVQREMLDQLTRLRGRGGNPSSFPFSYTRNNGDIVTIYNDPTTIPSGKLRTAGMMVVGSSGNARLVPAPAGNAAAFNTTALPASTTPSAHASLVEDDEPAAPVNDPAPATPRVKYFSAVPERATFKKKTTGSSLAV